MRKSILVVSILLASAAAQSALFGLFGTTVDTSDRGITISNASFESPQLDFPLPGDEKETRHFSGKSLDRYTSTTITQVTVKITVKGCNDYECTTYDVKEVDLFDFKDDDLLPKQARPFSKEFEHYIPKEANRYSFEVVQVKGY